MRAAAHPVLSAIGASTVACALLALYPRSSGLLAEPTALPRLTVAVAGVVSIGVVLFVRFSPRFAAVSVTVGAAIAWYELVSLDDWRESSLLPLLVLSTPLALTAWLTSQQAFQPAAPQEATTTTRVARLVRLISLFGSIGGLVGMLVLAPVNAKELLVSLRLWRSWMADETFASLPNGFVVLVALLLLVVLVARRR